MGGVAGGRSRRQPVPGPLQLALALAVAQDGAWLGCAQALGVLVGLAQRGCAHVARVVVASSLSKEGKVSTFTTLGSSLSLSLSLSLSSFGRHSELKAQKSSKNYIYDIHSLDLVKLHIFVFCTGRPDDLMLLVLHKRLKQTKTTKWWWWWWWQGVMSQREPMLH